VAEHAFRDGGDGSGWTNIRHAVAIEALKAEGEVFLVGVSDGLRDLRGSREKSETNHSKYDPRSHSAGSQGATTKPSVHTWIRHENWVRRSPHKYPALDQKPGYRATPDNSETERECQTCDMCGD